MEACTPRTLHSMIRVMELDKSVQFYTEFLGMKLIRKRSDPGGAIHFDLRRIRRLGGHAHHRAKTQLGS